MQTLPSCEQWQVPNNPDTQGKYSRIQTKSDPRPSPAEQTCEPPTQRMGGLRAESKYGGVRVSFHLRARPPLVKKTSHALDTVRKELYIQQEK